MKITIKELRQLIQETIEDNGAPLLDSPQDLKEGSMLSPRARDMFGKT